MPHVSHSRIRQAAREALWHALDRCLVLVPMMVAVLDDEGEVELLVELMDRYFPDADGQRV